MRVGEGLVGSDSDRLLSRSRDPDLFFISVSVLMHANKLLPYSLIAPTHLLLLLHLLLSHCTRPPTEYQGKNAASGEAWPVECMECKPGGPSCNAFLLFWRFCLSCLRPRSQTIMLKFFAVSSVSPCLSWHLVHQLSFCIKCKSGYSVHSLHCDTAKFSVSNMIDDQFTFCGKFFLTDPALYKGCNINLSIVQMQKEIANVNAGLGFCRAQDVLYKMCGPGWRAVQKPDSECNATDV